MSDPTDLSSAAASALAIRNLTIGDGRISVGLEPAIWSALEDMAKRKNATVHQIAAAVHATKEPATALAAALRVFLMLYYRAAATEAGHAKAGHGNFDAMLQRARLTKEILSRMIEVRSAHGHN